MAASGLRVAVLGYGQLARALVPLFAPMATVRVWSRRPVESPATGPLLTFGHDLAAVCQGAHVVLIAVPASGLRQVAYALGAVAQADQVVFLVTRGVQPDFALPHETLRQETCLRQIAFVGGPLQALQGSAFRSLAWVVATRYEAPIEALRRLGMAQKLRISTTLDLTGVEVASAMANVTLMAQGMAQAQGMDDMALGGLMTRGLGEAARLAGALGGRADTFTGLAGLGALMPRRAPFASGDGRLGVLLGQGKSLAEALALADPGDGVVKGASEGAVTACAAFNVAQRLGLKLPLVQAVHDVVTGIEQPKVALGNMLQRGLDVDAVPGAGEIVR